MSQEARVQNLLRAARRAARRAHAPYSNYTVGAALETEDGEIFLGANMENAAYPSGLCAERVALLLWRSAGGMPIRRVAVWTPSDPPGSPCGPCRDALVACAPTAEIWLAGPTQSLGPAPIGKLIPSKPGGAPAATRKREG